MEVRITGTHATHDLVTPWRNLARSLELQRERRFLPWNATAPRQQIVQPVVDAGTQILQPVGGRSIGAEPGEAATDRILHQVAEMAEPPSPHDQYGDQGEGHPERPVIGLEPPDGVELAESLDPGGCASSALPR